MRTTAWLIAAYVVLGLLIGNLTGMTAGHVTTSLLGLLFAFGGGSAIALLKDVGEEQRRWASQAIFALSLSCLVGLYAGIIVSERQLLTPQDAKAGRTSVADRKLLRQNIVEAAHSIDQRRANKQLSLKEAYDALYKTIVEREKE